MSRREEQRVLCVSESTTQLKEMCSAVSSIHYEAVSASTPQEAVACCSSNHVAAVVLDSEFLTEKGWSAAQSIKMLSPALPILLLEQGHNGDIPSGVDGVATTVSTMLQKLAALLGRTS
jgi:DNA-binding NtrC family response regulator